jgi:proteasome lid subunit RPN8/RPN11
MVESTGKTMGLLGQKLQEEEPVQFVRRPVPKPYEYDLPEVEMGLPTTVASGQETDKSAAWALKESERFKKGLLTGKHRATEFLSPELRKTIGKTFESIGEKMVAAGEQAKRDYPLSVVDPRMHKDFIENLKDPKTAWRTIRRGFASGITSTAALLASSYVFAKSTAMTQYSGIGPRLAKGIQNAAIGAGAIFANMAIGLGDMYEELIKQGAPPDDALETAMATEALVGSLDAVPEIGPIARLVKKAVGKKAVAKELAGELASNKDARAFIAEVLKKAKKLGAESGKQLLSEGFTEGLQGVVENAAKRIYNKHQNLFEGVPEEAFIGALVGAFFGGASVLVENAAQAGQVAGTDKTIDPRKPKDIKDLAREAEEDVEDKDPVIGLVDQIASEAARSDIIYEPDEYDISGFEDPLAGMEGAPPDSSGVGGEIPGIARPDIVYDPEGYDLTGFDDPLAAGPAYRPEQYPSQARPTGILGPQIAGGAVKPEEGAEVSYAEGIRGDEGPLYPGGVEPEAGERESGEDLERTPPEQPGGTEGAPQIVQEGPSKEEIDKEAHSAATSPENDLPEPTKPQIEAGNYKKGHVRIHGFDISIENPKGSVRSGVSQDGKKWKRRLRDHYGYIRGVKGNDKGRLDVFVGDNPESTRVFVVDQYDPKTGLFDEHKVMLGYSSEPEALAAYRRNYPRSWKGLGPIREFDVEGFKQWASIPENVQRPAIGPEKIEIPEAATRTEQRPEKAKKSSKPAKPSAEDAHPRPEKEAPPERPAEGQSESPQTEPTSSQPEAEQSQESTTPFDDMVDAAAKWRAAAMEADRRISRMLDEVSPETKRKLIARRMKIIRNSGKSALDRYIMDRFGVDEAYARSISNELTAKDISYDGHIDLEKYKDAPWYQFYEEAMDLIMEEAIKMADKEEEAGEEAGKAATEPSGPEASEPESEAQESMPEEAKPKGEKQEPIEKPKAGEAKAPVGEEIPLDRQRSIIAGIMDEFFQSDEIISGRDHTPPKISDIRKFVSQKMGWRGIKPGSKAIKQVEDLTEAAIILAAREIVRHPAFKSMGETDRLGVFVRMYEQFQPTLSSRTSKSMRNQAYSTPIPLAYIVQAIAQARKPSGSLKVLEPTAGTGMLLFGFHPNTDITAIELDKDRLSVLHELVPDAEQGDFLDINVGGHTVLVANPPFGKVRDKGSIRAFEVTLPDGETYRTSELDHAIAMKALSSMDPRGTAVIILGAPGEMKKSEEQRKKAYASAAKRKFFYNLQKNFNVVDHFVVSGKLYSKQGTSWPVDVIVVEGRGESNLPLPSVKAPPVITEWSQFPEEVLNGKETINQEVGRVLSPESVLPGGQAGGGRGGISGRSGGESGSTGEAGARPQAGGEADGRRRPRSSGPAGGSTGEAGSSLPDEEGTATSVGVGAGGGVGVDTENPEGGSVGRPDIQHPLPVEPNVGGGMADEDQEGRPGGTGVGDERAGVRRTESADRVSGRTGTDSERESTPRPTVRPAEEQQGPHQKRYRPESTSESLGTNIPINMADSVRRALSKVARLFRVDNPSAEHPIDEFVREKLGYDSIKDLHKVLSAEQIDAVALAIHNMEQGSGFILGDQTGVGKGRVVASMIRYAKRIGKIPVFITESPKLFSDMMRDLRDIGEELNPYTTLEYEAVDESGEVIFKRTKRDVQSGLESIIKEGSLGKYDAIFTTYSQLQTVKGQDTKRRELIRKIAADSVFLMDESHKASGQAATIMQRKKRGSGNTEVPLTMADFLRDVLLNVHGVMYASATFAKNPHAMTLYHRTDMRYVVARPEELAEALANGGVPLQQIVGNMLAESGQYIRREYTFEGIKFGSQEIPIPLEEYDSAAEGMRKILDFESRLRKVIRQLEGMVLAEAGITVTETGEKGQAGVDSTNFTSIMHNLIGNLLLASKADAVVEKAVEVFKAGEKPVIALHNTMEAAIKDFVESEDLSIGDKVDVDMKFLIHRYLVKARTLTVKDANGNASKFYIQDEMFIELGDEGIAALDYWNNASKFIESLELSSYPLSPIDYIINRLRDEGIRVGELTGRSYFLNYNTKDGIPVLDRRSPKESSDKGKRKIINAFNSGEIDAVIANSSASTGVSLHSSKNFKDQKKRHMIIAQAAPEINTFKQMLGRINRTGQVVKPEYTFLFSNVPAEKRPASLLMKKLSGLNATTTAARKTAEEIDLPDIFNIFGDRAVAQALFNERETGVYAYLGLRESDQEQGSGLRLNEDQTSYLPNPEITRKATGRVAILPTHIQAKFYSTVLDLFNQYLEEAIANGENPLEASRLDLRAKTLRKVEFFRPNIPQDVAENSAFTAPAYVELVEVNVLSKPMPASSVRVAIAKELGLKPDIRLDAYKRGDISRAEFGMEDEYNKARIAYHKRVIEQFDTEVDDYITAIEDNERLKPEAKERAINRVREQAADVRRMLETEAFIGSPVELSNRSTGYYGQGVILGFTRNNAVANPSLKSAWQVVVATTDEVRKIKIPLSKYDAPSGGFVVQRAMNEEEIWRDFDSKQEVRREKRVMLTGNLLAAFMGKNEKMNIVMFTREDGGTHAGVLLPKKADFDKVVKDAPVHFANGDQVVRFLKEKRHRMVSSLDKIISIQNHYGDMLIKTAAARSKAGHIFLDPQIAKLAGKKEGFFRSGNNMYLRLEEFKNAEAVVQYLLDEAGITLKPEVDKDRAKEIVYESFGKNDQQVTDEGQSQPSIVPTPPSVPGGPVKFESLRETPTPKGVVEVERLEAYLAEGEWVPLHGAKVGDSSELARLMTVYRNPEMEVAHLVYIKDGKVVHHEAATASLPEIVNPAFLGNRHGTSASEMQEYSIGRIAEVAERLGADEIYLVHNHPSGDPKPSRNDIEATKQLATHLPAFKGQIVIDGDRFVFINRHGRTDERKFPDGYKKPNPLDSIREGEHKFIGTAVRTTEDLVDFAAILGSVRVMDNPLIIILDSGMVVTGIYEIDRDSAPIYDPEAIRETSGRTIYNWLDAMARRTGPGVQAIVIDTAIDETSEDAKNLARLLGRGVFVSGLVSSESLNELVPLEFAFERHFGSWPTKPGDVRFGISMGTLVKDARNNLALFSPMERYGFDRESGEFTSAVDQDILLLEAKEEQIQRDIEEIIDLTEPIEDDSGDVRYRFGKRMKPRERRFRPPHWIAKRWPKFAEIYERQRERDKMRRRMLSMSLEQTSLFWDLKGEELNALRDLIWALDGRKIKDISAQKFVFDKKTGKGFQNEEHYRQLAEWLTKKSMDYGGLTKRVVDAYVQIRFSLDRDLLTVYESMRSMDDVDRGVVANFRQQMGQIENYFPHKRYGNYYVQITRNVKDEKTGKIKKEVVYREHFYAIGDKVAKRISKKIANRAVSDLDLGPKERLTLNKPEVGRVEPLPEDVFSIPIPVEAIEQVLVAASKRVGDQEAAELFKRVLPQAVADTLKSRGWGSHMIHRKGIPGHETNDIKRVLLDYKAGLYGWITKMEASRDFSKALRDVEAAKQPELYKAMRNYVYQVLRNQTYADQVSHAIRSVAFIKYLGGNIKTAAVNMTQNLISGIPRLGMDTKAASIHYMKAVRDLVAHATDGGKRLPSDERRLIKELFDEGTTHAAFIEEVRGIVGGPYRKTANRLLRVLGLPMEMAERFNRVTLALAAYRVARRGLITRGKVLAELGLNAGEKADHRTAKKYASTVVDDAHFVYGMANRPEVLRGEGGSLVASAYTFRSFSHNLINLWRWMWDQGGPGQRAIMKSMAATWVLGGLASLPLYKTILSMMRQLTGEDWTEEYVLSLIPKGANWLRDIVLYGVPSLAGMNIGGSLGMELPIVNRLRLDEPFARQIAGSAMEIVGVPWAVFQDIVDAIEYGWHGKIGRSAEALMPALVANVFRAYRMASEGMVSRAGTAINLPGEAGPSKLSGYEAVIKALGFQPTSATKAWDIHKTLTDFMVYRDRVRNVMVMRYVEAYRAGDKEEMKRIKADILEWNQKMMKDRHPEYKIDISRSVRSRARGRRYPKAFRPKAMELKERYMGRN